MKPLYRSRTLLPLFRYARSELSSDHHYLTLPVLRLTELTSRPRQATRSNHRFQLRMY
jgi:hypothetical protein